MIQLESAPMDVIRFMPSEARVRPAAPPRLSPTLPRLAPGVSRTLAHVTFAGVWTAGIAVLALTTAVGLQARAAALYSQTSVALRAVEESALAVHHLEAGYVTQRAWRQASHTVDRLAANGRLVPMPLVVNEVSSRRPDGVWLGRISVRDATLKICGTALAEDAVTAYLDQLAASPYIDFMTIGALRRVGDAAEPRFEFTILGRLATE